jgi:hypothetical protein
MATSTRQPTAELYVAGCGSMTYKKSWNSVGYYELHTWLWSPPDMARVISSMGAQGARSVTTVYE